MLVTLQKYIFQIIITGPNNFILLLSEMKKSVSILSLFILVASSIAPVGIWEAYYLNGDTSINYPDWNDIKFYDVAWNERAIMSYNLWATEDNKNWLFFQRWNNHAFSNDDSCDPGTLVAKSWQWSSEDENSGLRWGGESEDECELFDEYDRYTGVYGWTGLDQQWPCPSGYHVPTGKEWNNLLVQWCEDSESCDTRDLSEWDETHPNYRIFSSSNWSVEKSKSTESSVLSLFIQKYNLQLAGYRNSYGANSIGEAGHYSSSSFFDDSNSYVWGFFMYEPIFWLNWISVSDFNIGGSVRCFKDSTEEVPLALALNLYVWGCSSLGVLRSSPSWIWSCEDNFIDRIFVPANQTLSASKIAKLNAKYNWYTENTEDEHYKVDLDTIKFTQSTDLYWFSKCEDNEQYVDWECVEIKWWTAISNWNYECMAEWATYDEDLKQCIYTVTGYDGKTIVIMSSNLWVTEWNYIWLYYQWWKWYGFKPYILDTTPDYNKYAELSEDETTLFQSYDVNVLWNTWSTDDDPCPTWFHVPSMLEWNNLFISWCENDEECDTRYLNKSESPENRWALNDSEWHGAYADIVNRFVDDYNLWLVWSRDEYEINMFGMMWDYWSSERLLDGSDEDYHYGDASDMSSWGLTLYPEWWVWPLWFFSHMAASVRCFANVENETSTPIALDLYWWWCWEMLLLSSAIRVVEDSVICNNGGYIWRKFVWFNKEVDVNNLVNLPAPQNWHQWVWYLDNEQSQKLTSSRFTWDSKLYIFDEEGVTYTIVFDTAGWTPVNAIIKEYNTKIDTAPKTTRDGYTFAGWYDGNTKISFPYTVSWDKTLVAHWTENKWNGYSWWWGSSYKEKSSDKSMDKEWKKSEPEIKKEDWKNIKIITDSPEDTEKETFNAHQWAYSKWLTKYRTPSEARMDDLLNRSEMAKISSIFATEFLDKTPDKNKKEFCSQYSDMWKVEDDMKFFITESCELGYMWYESNGIDALERFRPYTPLTVAETATILSRIVWWNENAMNGKDWYKWHLYATYNHGLIDDIKNPTTRSITRKEAYTMLYRLVNMIN